LAYYCSDIEIFTIAQPYYRPSALVCCEALINEFKKIYIKQSIDGSAAAGYSYNTEKPYQIMWRSHIKLCGEAILQVTIDSVLIAHTFSYRSFRSNEISIFLALNPITTIYYRD